jgi:CheY-like chemotaxis protein
MVGGLSAPWKFLGKDHPAFELIGQKVALAIANPENLRIIQLYFEHWEIEPLVYESLEAVTDALVEGVDMDFLLVDTRLFTEHHHHAARQLAETCAAYQVHYGLLCEPAIAIALEESTNEYGWLLSKPLKRDDLLNALLHRRVAPKSGASLPDEDPDLGSEAPLRILIAEDNPINMDVARGMLRNLGYEPEAAENGLEVLKAVEANQYDVILMDVQMPELDGLETTRRLVKKYPREVRPLIVAMTANAMESDRQRCLEAGMDTFISKPFVMEEIIALVHDIISGSLAMPATYFAYRKEFLPGTQRPVLAAESADAPARPPVAAVPAELPAADVLQNGEALTSLDMLQEVSNGDTDFIKGILSKLVTKLPESIQELREALAKEDWETIRATSHRTKSSAAYSGAPELKEKFRVLEHMARESEDLDQVPARLDELEDYVNKVVMELKGHLERM